MLNFLRKFKVNCIRRTAYFKYARRECLDGHDKIHWFESERWWLLQWAWSIKIIRWSVYAILFLLILSSLFNIVWYQAIDYFVPASIKQAIVTREGVSANENIRPEILSYIQKETDNFKYPIIKEIFLRIKYLFFNRMTNHERPLVVVDQLFYSYTYPDSRGGLNYGTVVVICMKNIGSKTAVIKNATNFIDSGSKHDYDKHDFSPYLPSTIFPNEEMRFYFGQEIPRTTFVSLINIYYSELNNINTYSAIHKRNFMYDFSQRVYQFF